MPRHLQKRRRLWYALLDIPAALRPQFDGKRRFVKSLETTDLAAAQRRLGLVIAGWQTAMAQARPQAGVEAGTDDAAYFRRLLRAAATQAQREAVLEQIGDAADALGYLHAEIGQPPASVPEAQEFVGRATGAVVGTLEHLEEWLAVFRAKPRTKERRSASVRLCAEAFPLLRDITRQEVRRWAAGLNLGKSSTVIHLSAMAIYWRWLQAEGIVGETAPNPFEKIDLSFDAAAERQPFTPAEVVKLRTAAPDDRLRDLITLAMWTGARIEELCSLRVEHVKADSFRIVASKTAAGVREVPIHPKLRQTMARLIEESTDGFVLAGLNADRHGFRSNTMSRAFSTFKTKQGFGPGHTFHSIRRTVVTQLEDAGAAENVVASIVGHEVKTITYGLYSGGASLAVKAAALALLDYPG